MLSHRSMIDRLGPPLNGMAVEGGGVEFKSRSCNHCKVNTVVSVVVRRTGSQSALGTEIMRASTSCIKDRPVSSEMYTTRRAMQILYLCAPLSMQ